jgi:hypothetical protein
MLPGVKPEQVGKLAIPNHRGTLFPSISLGLARLRNRFAGNDEDASHYRGHHFSSHE